MEGQFLCLLAYVVEQERNKIHTRQPEGIAVAKANGKHLGRPQMNLNALTEKQKQTLEEFMTKLNLKRNTFYKTIKEYDDNLQNIKELRSTTRS